MKIIGTTTIPGAYNSTAPAYVCIISHAELQKVADKAGYNAAKIEPKVGDDYHIDQGHDFRREITDATKAMAEAYTKFAKVAPVAAQFAAIVASASEAAARADAAEAGGASHG